MAKQQKVLGFWDWLLEVVTGVPEDAAFVVGPFGEPFLTMPLRDEVEGPSERPRA